MKLISNIALTLALTGAALLLSANPAAAKPLSQNQALGQCKALASTQFDSVKSIKVANLKTTRGVFKTKLRVRAADDRGMFLCTIEANQEAQIVRLDKDVNALATE
ncbi:MAG: hypothetical protein ACJAQ6_002597 [Arenicella sp.]|jgi:hypothetical protein